MILRVAKSAINYKLGDVYVATDSKKFLTSVEKKRNSVMTQANIKSGTTEF